MESPPKSRPRTHQQRSAATRRIVNDATIRCLINQGYSGTTMSAVTAEAGVSRGALTHQFSSKREMLIAAIDHLSTRVEDQLRQAAADLPHDEDRLAAVIRLVWESHCSDLFYASFELWTAARTDDSLRDALQHSERRLGQRHRRLVTEILGPEIASRPNFGVALDLTFNLMRGVAMTSVLRDNKDKEQRLVDHWVDAFNVLAGVG